MSAAEYIELAMEQATYETLEDGTVYGEIPGFDGVWSDADTHSESEEELAEVLEEWVTFRQSKGLSLPEVQGVGNVLVT